MATGSRKSDAYLMTGNPYYSALAEVKSALAPILDNAKRDPSGIAVNHPQLLHARQLAAKVADPILKDPLPLPSQTKAELKAKGLDEDHFTRALLVGVNPEDGRDAGTAFITDGDGNCCANAVAQMFVGKKPRGIRNDVKSLAAKLRLSIVLEGLRHMEAYLSLQPHLFMDWSTYVSDVREKLAKKGWTVDPEVKSDSNGLRVGSSRCARLMFVAQLHHISANRAWVQQFIFPMVATVIRSPFRCFLPYHSLADAYGATWDHTTFQPLIHTGRQRPTVSVVMTMGSSPAYRPDFSDAQGWLDKNDGRLPELNHFVSLSSDNAAKVHSLAVKKFQGLAQRARESCRDAEAAVTDCLQQPDEDQSLLKARATCKTREHDCALLEGTYFTPLPSAEDAARADGDAYKKCMEEDGAERRRKAAAAASRSRSRTKKSSEGSAGGKTTADGESGRGAPDGQGAPNGAQSSSSSDKEAGDSDSGAPDNGDERGGQKGSEGGAKGARGGESDGVSAGGNTQVRGAYNSAQEKNRRILAIRARCHGKTAAQLEAKGNMDIVVGTRLHTGKWAKKGQWGTILAKTLDEDLEDVISYDVFMDGSICLSTVSAADVEEDVAHGRKLAALQNHSGSGDGGRGVGVGSTSQRGGGLGAGGRTGSGSEKPGAATGGCSKEELDDTAEGNGNKEGVSGRSKDKSKEENKDADYDDEEREKKEGVGGRSKDTSKKESKDAHDDDDEREKKERGSSSSKGSSQEDDELWPGGDAEGTATVGRAFNVLGSANETWDGVFDTAIGDLRGLGHQTLQHRRVKMTADKSRYKHCEIVCKHGGKPRKSAAGSIGTKLRKSASQQVGCPFKVTITWPLAGTNPTITSSNCDHNHDPRGAVSSSAEDVVPPSVVDDRMDDLRRWTANNFEAREIFKLLTLDHDGKMLCKIGKRKVYNAMQKIKEGLYSSPEDAANFLSTLQTEPGMFVARTFDATGRLVDVFWATVDQQEKMARFGGCIQLDTTAFTNRYGCPLLFIVGVDDQNRSCVLGQGLLRSECTETFEWFLEQYETAAGGRRPKVLLTDADIAMTSAVRNCWKTTLHLFCLWHIFKNVLKNCASSFPDQDKRKEMIRLFRSAAYAATPETFQSHRTKLEEIVEGTSCEEYIANLIEDKTKWAFSCRPTVLTLGMVATQRVEGLFSVAKAAGVDKKLSLCALWDCLQRFIGMLDIEHSRLGTPHVFAGKAFQDEHLQTFFHPIQQELHRVGASEYCQRELRDALGASTPYDVTILIKGLTDDDGYSLPLEGRLLRETIQGCTRRVNAFEEAPADTDLEVNTKFGPDAQSTVDSNMWARTSLTAFLALVDEVPINIVAAVRYNLTARKPSHIVVFGEDGFHLCSCLKLLRHGLHCSHYFAMLLRFIGGDFRGVKLRHDFDGSSVHNRWRKSPEGNDEPWTVSRVLDDAGHGDGWDGCVVGDDDNFWGATFDDDGGEDGVHPSERAVQAAQQRKESDQRRVYATMMARSKENVGEMLRTVPSAKALEIQAEVDKLVKFHLHDATKGSKAGNPNQAPKKGAPKKPDPRTKQGRAAAAAIPPQPPAGNPEGRQDNSRRNKRMRDGFGAGSGRSDKRQNRKDGSSQS